MKRTPSLSFLLVSGVAVAALVSSCTIETKTTDGSGGSGTTGGTSNTTGGTVATTGGADANTGGTSGTTGGASGTTGGTSASTGGSDTTPGGSAGASAGAGGDGTAGAMAGAGGDGGDGSGDAGGQGGASFDSCDACLDARCTKEFDACLADPVCFEDAVNGMGQYQVVVVECVDKIRATRPVKRADLRDCGNSVGAGASTEWPPQGMTVATVDLLNCMATGQTNESGNNAWANESNIMNPWAANSCAKLACTSQLP